MIETLVAMRDSTRDSTRDVDESWMTEKAVYADEKSWLTENAVYADEDWLIDIPAPLPPGTITRYAYVSGVRHGSYVQIQNDLEFDAYVLEGMYVNGKRQGRWKEVTKDGSTTVGECVDGIPHGPFEEILSTGVFVKGTYVNGTRQGYFEEKHPNGRDIAGIYVNGAKLAVFET